MKINMGLINYTKSFSSKLKSDYILMAIVQMDPNEPTKVKVLTVEGDVAGLNNFNRAIINKVPEAIKGLPGECIATYVVHKKDYKSLKEYLFQTV